MSDEPIEITVALTKAQLRDVASGRTPAPAQVGSAAQVWVEDNPLPPEVTEEITDAELATKLDAIAVMVWDQAKPVVALAAERLRGT